ncbi:MAG: hypothetical protein IJV92_05130 [Phascolarctobacterium sp.]|nr:hypothetical protein [Phascolarctobacterium sp.]
MRKSLLILMLACIFTLVNAVAALAYNPGQRTIQLLGSTLNSDKHPVHLVITQKIDMAEILTPEAYNKLTPAQKVRYSRTEYNEANGINAERNTKLDGEGKVISDTTSFIKDGYWYTIDYVNKTYDRLPELPGMSMPFAETLISWFGVRPEGGIDAATGYDYDKMIKGSNSLYFYYEKDTANWKGYKVSYLPMFHVEEVSNVVNAEAAFALPPADFKQKANEGMRNYANRLMGGGKKK